MVNPPKDYRNPEQREQELREQKEREEKEARERSGLAQDFRERGPEAGRGTDQPPPSRRPEGSGESLGAPAGVARPEGDASDVNQPQAPQDARREVSSEGQRDVGALEGKNARGDVVNEGAEVQTVEETPAEPKQEGVAGEPAKVGEEDPRKSGEDATVDALY